METPTDWTERHSQLVADAAPPVSAATEAELTRTWNVVRETTTPATAARRRPARLVVGAALTAATLAVGGVAAATILSAHTGEYPVDAADVRMGGPGEELNPVASDFGEVVTETIADIPFPSDAARASVRDNLVADGQDNAGSGESIRVSTGAVRAWAAQGAMCAWADQWAGATSSGDAATREQAAGMLKAASMWPAVTDVDPVQKSHTQKMTAKDVETGETITGTADDSTQFAFLRAVQKASRGDSVHAMDAAMADIYCYGVSTPNLPLTAAGNR